MSKSYNVPTKNRFAQLDSDAESEHESKPVKKVTSEAPATITQRRERPSRTTNQESREPRPHSSEDRPARGRGGQRGAGGFRSNAPTSPIGADDDVIAPEGRVDTRNRGGRRFLERGGRGAFSGRGREFERRSGTGRGKEMKKSGAGGHNWGSEIQGPEGAPVTPSGEGQASDSEQQQGQETPVEGDGSSTPEAEKPKEESEGDKFVDFAEWQKTQKQKRAQLLQEKAPSGIIRTIDAAELEKDGYQRYEREETEQERAAREARINQAVEESSESENEDDSRPKTYNVYEFSGFTADYRRGNRGRRSRGGLRERRLQGNLPPVSLDLQSEAAFPSL